MMTFSDDPTVAEAQMRALIFHLTAFGYIDGHFEESEQVLVRSTIRNLVTARAEAAMSDTDERQAAVATFVSYFEEVFGLTSRMIHEWFDDAVADGEDARKYVYAKLKLRSFELFAGFDRKNQQALLGSIEDLLVADGTVHPQEVQFRDELVALLHAEPSGQSTDVRELLPRALPQLSLEVAPVSDLPIAQDDHSLFKPNEQHYSANPDRIREQVDNDLALFTQFRANLDEARQRGADKLRGKRTVDEFAHERPFLDGHVYVHPASSTPTEVIVLGDLHGCYSCLKAAVLQSDFLGKVAAHRQDPNKHPDVKLVLLGDYIDRGIYSYNGVLRGVLQLYLEAPEHVYVLRGNHEYYVEMGGRIYGGVKPAEAINSLIHHMPSEMFVALRDLFETMPNMLLFGRVLFVHAGIPRDKDIAERYQDLSSLNDSELRFQMLWSDPSPTDYIPDELQAASARFSFGKLQFERFMAQLGCHTLVRGHEKFNEGFKVFYEDGRASLLSLFSAGGATNDDLPPESSYREVVPMALTMHISDAETKVVPWPIQYETYNHPARNAFFASPAEIAHKVG